MIHPLLKAQIEPLARRRRQLRLWSRLAAVWAVTALVGLVAMAAQKSSGWSSGLALPIVALGGVAAALVIVSKSRREVVDWRSLALEIEKAHPELDGRLVTAVQQEPLAGGGFNYLQQRVLEETIAHNKQTGWSGVVPVSRLRAAHLAHVCCLALCALVLWGLRVPGGHGLLFVRNEGSISVTPGDVALEMGSSLVVMARFESVVPGKVDLVVEPSNQKAQRIPLSRSLADPLFGGTVPEVTTNLVYHLEYAGSRTKDYRVTVFEYPRLERSDADLLFPDYTGQPARHIDNTRRVSAVEGSQLGLTLHLNKPVTSAMLRGKGTNGVSIPLHTDGTRPVAALTNYLLAASTNLELRLVDAEGRTNKVAAEFVFNALKNRTPEIKITSPLGDTRPSALQEVSFDGTVWDDFGVQAYGLAYAIPGKEPKLIELGEGVPAKEKRPFHFLLRLEDLEVQPDDLLSWFIWADDIGPDAKVRRTTGDLFFAEVRPFEQIFREGQPMASDRSQQQGQSGEGGPAERLADMQKQIISATWNVFRQQGLLNPAGNPGRTLPSAREPKSPRSTAVPNHRRTGSKFAFAETSLLRGSVIGQARDDSSGETRSSRRFSGRSGAASGGAGSTNSLNDVAVLQDAQAQALEQAQAARDRQPDPRTLALWETVTSQMEKALEQLKTANKSSTAYQEALAAEQAAYQSLLKLQEREFSVSRSRNQQGNRSGRQQQMQRELEQLDLTKDEDRYETEQQARAPQDPARRDQLQVINRLQELARRQQDLNERLKELQTALQEAQTEKEREDVRRQLKRLQEQEQEMLADADEIRQIMDRPENQSRMTDQRRQLEQARNDLQRAAEATQQGQPSQALASGTRAQQQLQDLRNEMRQQSAGEFDQELRQMRSDARELARREEEIQKQIESMNDRQRRTLSDADLNEQTLQDLAKQRERLTNLVQNATQLSQEAEGSEPLMSRELYDTLRKFSQNDVSTLKQFQEELMNRGLVSRDLYERLKRTGDESGAKSLDLTSEMLRQGFLREADLAEQRARAEINDLKRGVERAAESVLGDDAESLRQAREALDRLAKQLEREMAQAERGGTNRSAEVTSKGSQPGQDQENGQQLAQGGEQAGQQQGREQGGQQQGGENRQQSSGQSGQQGDRSQSANTAANAAANEGNPNGGQRTPGQSDSQRQTEQAQAEPAQDPSADSQAGESNTGQRGGRQARPSDQPQRGRTLGGNQTSDGGGGAAFLDRLFDPGRSQWTGPITGEDFGPWSDALREVEEMIDTPAWRNDVAQARERARQLRQDFRRNQKKPDWANVRLQVMKPLVEVSNQISEELARRGPREDLVPIDRDPVPGRYTELVRRYYEQLGKGNAARENSPPNPQN